MNGEEQNSTGGIKAASAELKRWSKRALNGGREMEESATRRENGREQSMSSQTKEGCELGCS